MNSSTLDFITKLLSDTLHLHFHYFIAPYPNLSAFDQSLRDSLEDSETLYSQVQEFLLTMEKNTFYFVTDSYAINYIFFFPFVDKQDIVAIGPYFNNPINDDYWHEITENNHLTAADIQNIKGFLFGIPQIDNNLHLISIISNIVSYINKEDITPFSINYHDFSNSSKDSYIYTPKDNFEAYFDAVFNRYKIEKELLNHIRNGDWEKALVEAERFMRSPIEPRLKNTLRDQKFHLTSANTLFRKAVEGNEIHPVYLHEISSKFVHMIELTSSEGALHTLYEQMIREYCLLVQSKSRNTYSLSVRKILDYIEFNLNLPLTLNSISEKFNLSAPYISSQFKKEVGTTVIRYINQLRINEAIKLLDSSSMSIQDIAAYVGIPDYNYFTKVFKKERGLTPSDYRKDISK
jgi:AraC-like DNA-binding protein